MCLGRRGGDTVKLRRPSCAVEMTERLWEKIREVSMEMVRQSPRDAVVGDRVRMVADHRMRCLAVMERLTVGASG